MNNAISKRWERGGDKREAMERDEQRAFWERVQAEQEEILDALRAAVSTWTENTIEWGADPRLEGFVTEFVEWDHEQLYNTIEAEINRVKGLMANAFGD